MEREEVLGGLRGLLVDMLDVAPESITADSTLFVDLEVDSLSIMELAVFAEETYEVELDAMLRDATSDSERSTYTLGRLADEIVDAASRRVTAA